MTEQLQEQEKLQEPEVVEEPSGEDEIVAAIQEVRGTSSTPEEAEESASTEPSEVEEPSETPEAPTQTDDDDLEEARRIRDFLRSNPEMAQTIVAVEQGQAAVIPRQVLEAAERYKQERSQPQVEPEIADDFEERFYQDPVAAVREMQQAFEQRIAAQEQYISQQTQAEMYRQNEENSNLLVSTGESWQSSHPELTDEMVRERIVPTVAETNLISRFLKKHGNKERAIKEAFEAAYRIEFPDAARAATQDQIIRDATRKRRAGATAASPRSASRTAQPEERPKSGPQRVQYIADLIREEQAAQQ